MGIGYTDSDPLPAGSIGFYAYNIGGIEDGDDYTFFGEVDVFAYDDDDDGVMDDEDNCEDVANEDQQDLDGDGIGSACDDDEGSGDESAGSDGGGGDRTF